jgi:hypothetical protein
MIGAVKSMRVIGPALLVAALLASTAGARPDGRYGGLGATVAAFYAGNPHGSGTPYVGDAYYHVVATRNGRVIAYSVVSNFKPPAGERDRITLLGGIDLPEDAVETNLNSNTCLVWRSRQLSKLIGMQYAAATTTPYSDSATMRAESKPHC